MKFPIRSRKSAMNNGEDNVTVLRIQTIFTQFCFGTQLGVSLIFFWSAPSMQYSVGTSAWYVLGYPGWLWPLTKDAPGMTWATTNFSSCSQLVIGCHFEHQQPNRMVPNYNVATWRGQQVETAAALITVYMCNGPFVNSTISSAGDRTLLWHWDYATIWFAKQVA